MTTTTTTTTSVADIEALVRAYRTAWTAFSRACDRAHKCAVAAQRAAPDLMLADEYDAQGAVFVVEHTNEVRDVLTRHGWFDARRRVQKAEERLQAVYAAVLAAPVTAPSDILAKMRARHYGTWTIADHDAHDDDEQLFGAIWRDLEVGLARTA